VRMLRRRCVAVVVVAVACEADAAHEERACGTIARQQASAHSVIRDTRTRMHTDLLPRSPPSVPPRGVHSLGARSSVSLNEVALKRKRFAR
jgi:hypothetical protein